MLRILLIEDSPDDAELLRLRFVEAGIAVTITQVSNRLGLTQCLRRDCWDLLISDHHLPDLDAPTVLALSAANRLVLGLPELPGIVLSGEISDEDAAQALALGARDCLRKNEAHRLILLLQRERAHLPEQSGSP